MATRNKKRWNFGEKNDVFAHTYLEAKAKSEKRWKKARNWQVTLPDGKKFVVTANTKSQARALAKKKLQPGSKTGSLPPGTVVADLK